MDETTNVSGLTRPKPIALNSIVRIINQKLNSGVDYRVILDEVFEILRKYIPFERLSIATIQDGNVVLLWLKSSMNTAHLTIGYKSRLKESSLRKIAEEKKPRIIDDLRKYLIEHPDSSSSQRALADGVLSSLTYPFISKGSVSGFIFFSSSQAHTYTQRHMDLYKDLVDELSLLVRFGVLHNYFEQNKEKGKLLSMTLHELRSPLSVIQGYLDLAKYEGWFGQLDNKSQDLFSILNRNAGAMVQLISELEASSQSENRHDLIHIRNVSMQSFCAQIVSSAEILVAQKNIAFEIAMSPDLPVQWTFDPGKIEQVLNNLLSNAVKFSYPESKIVLRVQSGKNVVNFAVSDSGQGIPATELPLLFQYFGKTSTRPTAGEASTGLGLAISKRIVEAHSGGISVESEVGYGSSFSFWLPRHSLSELSH